MRQGCWESQRSYFGRPVIEPQVLTPRFEEVFSEHSYGFRPGRSTHRAVQYAQTYIVRGNEWVVDINIEKYCLAYLRNKQDCVRPEPACGGWPTLPRYKKP